MKRNYLLTSILFFSFVLFLNCDNDNEVAYVGEATIAAKLQFSEAISGRLTDVPAGARVSIYYENSPTALYSGATTEGGLFTYKAPAIGKYHMIVQRKDTILQFNSTLVKQADIDTLRSNEFEYISYTGSDDFQIQKNSRVERTIVLEPALTAIRLKTKDQAGNVLRNVSFCVYDNVDFYNSNFPYCGGSIKYLSTNNEGIALLTGLNANTMYYINAKGKIGVVEVSNHYEWEAQIVVSGEQSSIKDVDLVLKAQ